MTLIAAIPCESGFLFAADTRETVGDTLRQPVRKLNAIQFARKSVLFFGGAGDADLLDDFEEVLRRSVAKNPPRSLPEVAELLERRLKSFYRTDVGNPDGNFLPLFGVSLLAKRACGAWIARRKRLIPLLGWELLGLDYLFYKHVLRRLLPPNPTVPQALLTALHVFATAGATSTGIEAEPDVFFFSAYGAWRERSVHIRAIQASLLGYEEQLNKVFLACADTSVSTEQVKKQLETFKDAAVNLHRGQIQGTAERMFAHGASMPDAPLPRVPPGSVISVGPGVHVWEPEQLESARPGFVPKVKPEVLAELGRDAEDDTQD